MDDDLRDLMHAALEGGPRELRALTRELIRQGHALDIKPVPTLRYVDHVGDLPEFEGRLADLLWKRFGIRHAKVRCLPPRPGRGGIKALGVYEPTADETGHAFSDGGSWRYEEMVRIEGSQFSELWDKTVMWALEMEAYEQGQELTEVPYTPCWFNS